MCMWESAAEEIVEQLLASLSAADPETRLDAAEGLSDIAQNAYGVNGAALGAKMRDLGGVQQLTALLSDHDLPVRVMVLFIVGNLCSDAVDPNSALTKTLLLEQGAAPALLACAASSDLDLRTLACAALQNLCHEPAWARCVVSSGVVPLFEAFLSAPGTDARVVHYTSGLLQNVVRSLEAEGAPPPRIGSSAWGVVCLSWLKPARCLSWHIPAACIGALPTFHRLLCPEGLPSTS